MNFAVSNIPQEFFIFRKAELITKESKARSTVTGLPFEINLYLNLFVVDHLRSIPGVSEAAAVNRRLLFVSLIHWDVGKILVF